jgi:hypothetical protein
MKKQPPLNENLFAISLPRLIILSFISLGLYEVYWFSRNWKALSKTNSEIKHTVWRSLFSIFYCYSLFKIIFGVARKQGLNPKINPGLLAISYIILSYLGVGLARNHNLSTPIQIAIAIAPLSVIPLIPVQQVIRSINNHETIKSEFKPRFGEVAIILIGFILFMFVVVSTLRPMSTIPYDQNQAKTLLKKAQQLSAEYNACSDVAKQRLSVLDKTSQPAIDSYNSYLDKCESVRVEQNATVSKYNSFVGAR